MIITEYILFFLFSLASPSKFDKDRVAVQLPETDTPSVFAGEGAVLKPGTAIPSEVTKEESEDQGVSPSHDISKAGDYSLDVVRGPCFCFSIRYMMLAPVCLSIASRYDWTSV